MPDHSTLSRTRARLPLEVHDADFALVLGLVAERELEAATGNITLKAAARRRPAVEFKSRTFAR